GATLNRKELAVDRAAKAESITELSGLFKTSNVVVVAHYSGLTVAQMQTLRKQMKQAGAQVKVAKNRLAKIALMDTDAACIAPLLKGATVLAYSGDPVGAPKVAIDFAKANERFVILGGSMGKTTLDPNGVKALAALPLLDELRAKIVGLIQAPATKIAQLANGPAAKLARVVQAYASKGAPSLPLNTHELWFEPIGIDQWLTNKRSLTIYPASPSSRRQIWPRCLKRSGAFQQLPRWRSLRAPQPAAARLPQPKRRPTSRSCSPARERKRLKSSRKCVRLPGWA